MLPFKTSVCYKYFFKSRLRECKHSGHGYAFHVTYIKKSLRCGIKFLQTDLLETPKKAHFEPPIQENKPSAKLPNWLKSQHSRGIADQAGSLSVPHRLTQPRAQVLKQPSLCAAPTTADSRGPPDSMLSQKPLWPLLRLLHKSVSSNLNASDSRIFSSCPSLDLTLYSPCGILSALWLHLSAPRVLASSTFLPLARLSP